MIVKHLVETIEKLLDTTPCVMLEFVDNKVFHLVEHWRYIDYSKSHRVVLGESAKPNTHLIDNRYLYIYSKEHLNTLINNDKGGN